MKWTAALCATILAVAADAWGGMESDVAVVRDAWARIQYQLPPADQAAAFERLMQQAAQVMDQYPQRAEPAIWHGIVAASYAGAKGGLAALAAAKDARKSLEKALALDATALGGSAYTSLGVLYYRVPGWPLGFGDDARARELLEKGVAASPTGIDSNYFLGDYLLRMGDYAGAGAALRKALQAPPRPGRDVADAGRRKEIQALLQQIQDRKR